MTSAAPVVAETEATRQIKRLNVLLLVVFAAILAIPAIGSWWISRQIPTVNTVEIDNVRIESAAALCPGEPLVVSYDFHAKGAGILVRDWTLWRTDPPPRTLIYSTARRFILDGPIDQHLIETWHIPHTYLNYETEKREPIPPGGYRRYLAISSPSRSSVVAIIAVNFEIKGDCTK